MKGVILAGGTGSRLMPLTQVTNKHLLPIYKKPMIFYPIELFREAGVTDIMIVTGTHHAGAIFQLLGSGKDFGCKFTFRVQDEAGGIPQAIALAEGFVREGEKFIAMTGDNVLFESIKPFVDDFRNSEKEEAVLLFNGTRDDASKSGIAIFEGERITQFLEKPKDPPSTWIATGTYFLSSNVFDVIRTLKPSKRNELEVVDIHNTYLAKNKIKAYFLKDHWLDAGTIDELLRANKIVQEKAER